MNPKQANCVVLLSGGLDSATCLALAQSHGYRCHALTFQYGQKHAVEVKRAACIASQAGISLKVIELELFGDSSLLRGSKDDIPTAPSKGIPSTWVPARNFIFLAYATAYAASINAQNIYVGVNAVDYSGYPDCRPEFIVFCQKAASLSLDKNVQIHSPLQHLTKAEIIKIGSALNVDYGLTHSCYNPNQEGLPCGVCDSCKLRLKGFEEAGMKDPLLYA